MASRKKKPKANKMIHKETILQNVKGTQVRRHDDLDDIDRSHTTYGLIKMTCLKRLRLLLRICGFST